MKAPCGSSTSICCPGRMAPSCTSVKRPPGMRRTWKSTSVPRGREAIEKIPRRAVRQAQLHVLAWRVVHRLLEIEPQVDHVRRQPLETRDGCAATFRRRQREALHADAQIGHCPRLAGEGEAVGFVLGRERHRRLGVRHFALEKPDAAGAARALPAVAGQHDPGVERRSKKRLVPGRERFAAFQRDAEAHFLMSASTSTASFGPSRSFSACSAARPHFVSCSPLPPESPTPPTTSPFTTTGKPPTNAAKRPSKLHWMPKASLPGSAGPFGGVVNRWVERLCPAAVKALFQAICGPVTRAPSMRSSAIG